MVDSDIKDLVFNERYRITSEDGSTYICITCHRTIKRNSCPAQAKANGMELKEFPEELKDFNGLELHLFCR